MARDHDRDDDATTFEFGGEEMTIRRGDTVTVRYESNQSGNVLEKTGWASEGAGFTTFNIDVDSKGEQILAVTTYGNSVNKGRVESETGAYSRTIGKLVDIEIVERAETDELAADGGRELDGDHPLDVRCNQCDSEYRIDETVSNDCPECGVIDFEIVDSDPEVATDGGVRPLTAECQRCETEVPQGELEPGKTICRDCWDAVKEDMRRYEASKERARQDRRPMTDGGERETTILAEVVPAGKIEHGGETFRDGERVYLPRTVVEQSDEVVRLEVDTLAPGEKVDTDTSLEIERSRNQELPSMYRVRDLPEDDSMVLSRYQIRDIAESAGFTVEEK